MTVIANMKNNWDCNIHHCPRSKECATNWIHMKALWRSLGHLWWLRADTHALAPLRRGGGWIASSTRHEPSSPSVCWCLLVFFVFLPQQRNYPRTSLRRPEPTAGGTGAWTWQRRLSQPAAPAAVTDAASAPRPPLHTRAPPPSSFCLLLLSWTTSRPRACRLPNVRTSCQPHSPGNS